MEDGMLHFHEYLGANWKTCLMRHYVPRAQRLLPRRNNIETP